MTVFAQAPNGSLRYSFLWGEIVPSNSQLVSVTYQITGEGTLAGQFIDTVAQTSTIQMEGIPHGSICRVTALATLSNTEMVPDQQIMIRGFNG